MPKIQSILEAVLYVDDLVLEDAEAFAQERPAAGLALATGAGVLLAIAMSRR